MFSFVLLFARFISIANQEVLIPIKIGGFMYNYFVGIDIARYDHFTAILNSSQEIVKNNIEGFEKLKLFVAITLTVCSLWNLL